ncbi:MAG: zinc-binding alcohol dehydrogenase [Anaerolineae bacterium]
MIQANVNRFIQFSAPKRAEMQTEPVAEPKAGEVLVQTACSAVSAGTELLVYRGDLPDSMQLDATIEDLKTQIDAWPVRYGYANVGRVTKLGDGVESSWENRYVFAFNPHESHFVAKLENLMQIPTGIDPEDAAFLPNMETAVSFVMDSRPLIGETIVVMGLGIVGQLTLKLLAQMSLGRLIGIDPVESRRNIALESGATAVFNPTDPALIDALGEGGADAVLELSGNPAALNSAVHLAGYNGRILIGSWYGKKQAPLDLGSSFHRSNIEIFASQVSRLHPNLTGRWTKERRLEVAWKMIAKHRPSTFITHRPDVSEATAIYEMLDQRPEEALQVLFKYDN